jgi:hypothetical protein
MHLNAIHLLIFLPLSLSFSATTPNESGRPTRLEIITELNKTEKQLSSLKKQKIMFTTAALLSLGALYYLPEHFSKDFSPFHLYEALLRTSLFVIGGNCGKQAYELQKAVLGLVSKKNTLNAKLGEKSRLTKDVCKQGSLCLKENLMFSLGIFFTIGLWYCLPPIFAQDYSFEHIAEATARTTALTVGGNCLLELYETKKAQSDALKGEFLVPLQKTPPTLRAKPPVLDLTKLSEYSGEYSMAARARRHNSMPSPHKKSTEFE